MGLVSKKRKIKSTDPFSKKFRTLDDDLVADDVHELAPPGNLSPFLNDSVSLTIASS